ncbi:hypothetical protein E2320_013399 [Naja naja]|nr:hypothetical protein E2320_013399 [Naja naja]
MAGRDRKGIADVLSNRIAENWNASSSFSHHRKLIETTARLYKFTRSRAEAYLKFSENSHQIFFCVSTEWNGVIPVQWCECVTSNPQCVSDSCVGQKAKAEDTLKLLMCNESVIFILEVGKRLSKLDTFQLLFFFPFVNRWIIVLLNLQFLLKQKQQGLRSFTH